jgi:hypothetical protein
MIPGAANSVSPAEIEGITKSAMDMNAPIDSARARGRPAAILRGMRRPTRARVAKRRLYRRWPHDELPVDTSGDNLSEVLHGMQIRIEAVRRVATTHHAFVSGGNVVRSCAMIFCRD